jgi:hypothetical protein
MSRGINSGSIQIRPDDAQNQGRAGRKRGINNLFPTQAKSNGSNAVYAAKARCGRGAMPRMAES